MNWIAENYPSMLAGLGLILLLALLTRGNLKGKKGESEGGCAGCSCQGGCQRKEENPESE